LSSFSLIKQLCQKTHPLVVEKMFLCFRGIKVLVCKQENETTQEITEATKPALRNVQHIIKTQKSSGLPSSLWKKCWKKIILNEHGEKPFKCLLKSNG